jgi:hypothetical protein
MRGGSDRLPLSCFRLQDQRFTVRALSGHPSTGRASCSRGTSPLIREASPSANIDSTNHVSMSHPAAIKANVGSVLRLVTCSTSRTVLGRVGRVYRLDTYPQTLCLVEDEARELIEGPCVLPPVVFAG